MKFLDRYYVAYGSNLNIAEMKARCPWATLHKLTYLNNYELVFKGQNGVAYLTVEPNDTWAVPVALWRVTQYDKDLLDAYEGYPSLYSIKEFDMDIDGRTYPCFMYVMNEDLDYELPTMYYYKRCEEGYEILEFDKQYLTSALYRTIAKSSYGVK